MWAILEAKSVVKEVKRLPREIQKAYEAWKNIILASGPQSLHKINGYWDHALKGIWKGARASSLSKQWRVIYVVQAEAVQVIVLRVSPHDYK